MENKNNDIDLKVLSHNELKEAKETIDSNISIFNNYFKSFS